MVSGTNNVLFDLFFVSLSVSSLQYSFDGKEERVLMLDMVLLFIF